MFAFGTSRRTKAISVAMRNMLGDSCADLKLVERGMALQPLIVPRIALPGPPLSIRISARKRFMSSAIIAENVTSASGPMATLAAHKVSPIRELFQTLCLLQLLL